MCGFFCVCMQGGFPLSHNFWQFFLSVLNSQQVKKDRHTLSVHFKIL